MSCGLPQIDCYRHLVIHGRLEGEGQGVGMSITRKGYGGASDERFVKESRRRLDKEHLRVKYSKCQRNEWRTGGLSKGIE